MKEKNKEEWQKEREDFQSFVKSINERTLSGQMTLYDRSFMIYSATNGMTPSRYIGYIDEKSRTAPDAWNPNNAIIAGALLVMMLFTIFYFVSPDNSLTGFMTYDPKTEIYHGGKD